MASPARPLKDLGPGLPESLASSPPHREFIERQKALFASLDLDVRSRFLHADDPDRLIHVLEAGSGPPVLMIHGGNSVSAGWAPLLQQLCGRYHVYAPDRPGCGLTHAQDYRGMPSFRDHALEFVEEVMAGVGLGRATLVGNSMGGYWALLFALAHPERVERVILLGEPAGSMERPIAIHRLGATPVVNRLLFATVARPRPDGRLLVGLMADRRRASAELIACLYAGARLPGRVLAWRTMLERVVPRNRALELTRALAPELASLHVPVLLAWGDKDFAPVEGGRFVAAHLPNARLEEVADCGHLLWLDHPEIAGALVEEAFTMP